MANMCTNSMAIYGDRAELAKLLTIINEARANKDPHTNQVDLTFLLAGYTEAELDDLQMPASFYSSVDDEISTGKYGVTYFKVWYESKWSPAYEAWDELLRYYFPKLKEVTICDESGNGIYVNTDEEGYFFPERYYVDGAVGNHYTNEEDPYCETAEQALAVINAMCEKAGVKTFGTIADALDFFEEEENNPFPDQDFFLSVNEYSCKL